MDLEEQYDKIYRFCYYRTRNRETAQFLLGHGDVRTTLKIYTDTNAEALTRILMITRKNSPTSTKSGVQVRVRMTDHEGGAAPP